MGRDSFLFSRSPNKNIATHGSLLQGGVRQVVRASSTTTRSPSSPGTRSGWMATRR